jgi:hypothetical protein
MQTDNRIPVEHPRYATVLHWGTLAGFIILIATFVAYLFGWLPSHVPVEQLPELWKLSTAEYLKATNTPTGWNWLTMLGHGDLASLTGIALLSASSIVCLVAVLPIYLKSRNFTYLAIGILEIAVLLLSASGIFSR